MMHVNVIYSVDELTSLRHNRKIFSPKIIQLNKITVASSFPSEKLRQKCKSVFESTKKSNKNCSEWPENRIIMGDHQFNFNTGVYNESLGFKDKFMVPSRKLSSQTITNTQLNNCFNYNELKGVPQHGIKQNILPSTQYPKHYGVPYLQMPESFIYSQSHYPWYRSLNTSAYSMETDIETEMRSINQPFTESNIVIVKRGDPLPKGAIPFGYFYHYPMFQDSLITTKDTCSINEAVCEDQLSNSSSDSNSITIKLPPV